MLKVTNIIASILFLVLSISATTISAASENLELVTWGSVLPNATIDAHRASLNIQVEIGDDVPLKTPYNRAYASWKYATTNQPRILGAMVRQIK